MSIIAGVEGTVEAKHADSVVVRVGGGILLRVFVPAHDLGGLPGADSSVRLHTHLIVREDDLQLYGFASEHGRRLFEMLIGVSQVGPKAALAVLSVLPPEDLATAIVAGDATAISRAPGVGKRTAERIILDLKGKLEEEIGAPMVTTAGVTTTAGAAGDPALQWLMALGYSALEARQALAAEDG
ncbi:MAG: Holliday junction branch migration protein RuvA, partial [Chloroflexi bacterium]|nr:Holliday junction branch migration protein RuvA [Chloroflexota bacterium]